MVSILRMMFAVYRTAISPVLAGLGCGCRFHPCCSEYARDAFLLHPPGRAILLVAKRLLRCGPWHPGGIDRLPVISA
ncbi:MAG: membrane protein insertion efficiency factor YidD [Pseudomonadota bacterium]